MKEGLTPLIKIGRGFVARLGRDQYMAVIKTNHGDYHELLDLDPHSAQTAAEDFCRRNGIALQMFSTPPDVRAAHLNDIGDFLAEPQSPNTLDRTTFPAIPPPPPPRTAAKSALPALSAAATLMPARRRSSARE